RSCWTKSWIVPFTTSVGEGRKSAGAMFPYVRTHHTTRTSAGATSPSTNAVERGSGARSSKRERARRGGALVSAAGGDSFAGALFAALIPSGSFRRQDDLDVRAPVELAARLRGIRCHRVGRAAPD